MVDRNCKFIAFISMKYQVAKFVSGRIGIFYSSILEARSRRYQHDYDEIVENIGEWICFSDCIGLGEV